MITNILAIIVGLWMFYIIVMALANDFGLL
jgi:hypothetical protein